MIIIYLSAASAALSHACSDVAFCCSAKGNENAFLESNGIEYETAWDLWQNIAALGIFTLFFMCLAYIALRQAKKLKWRYVVSSRSEYLYTYYLRTYLFSVAILYIYNNVIFLFELVISIVCNFSTRSFFTWPSFALKHLYYHLGNLLLIYFDWWK